MMMRKSYLRIADAGSKGRGVFTVRDIPAGRVLETAPVVVMSAADRKLLDKTALHDYIFEWGEDGSLCCMALGWVAVYNHSYASNCEYFMDYGKQLIRVETIRAVAAGEELTINYNGDWNDGKRVWFDKGK
jgi:SET domain-containing protein